ncbi:MAG TPA: hypothetical protein VMW27_23030 [Thermoanaerobaculia bacterium]|nr:hypothetical protein [Thermoanaerobaculia bacterium]
MKTGITGHRDLGSAKDAAWVGAALEDAVVRYRVTQGLASLAVGADQIFTELLRERGISYLVVIPSQGYEGTFEEDEVERYRSLLASAAGVVSLPFEAPGEAAYFAAGREVVERSELLFAVWDGQKAKGLGGTGDVVEYALSLGRKVVHIDPVNRLVTEKR